MCVRAFVCFCKYVGGGGGGGARACAYMRASRFAAERLCLPEQAIAVRLAAADVRAQEKEEAAAALLKVCAPRNNPD